MHGRGQVGAKTHLGNADILQICPEVRENRFQPCLHLNGTAGFWSTQATEEHLRASSGAHKLVTAGCRCWRTTSPGYQLDPLRQPCSGR